MNTELVHQEQPGMADKLRAGVRNGIAVGAAVVSFGAIGVAIEVGGAYIETTSTVDRANDFLNGTPRDITPTGAGRGITVETQHTGERTWEVTARVSNKDFGGGSELDAKAGPYATPEEERQRVQNAAKTLVGLLGGSRVIVTSTEISGSASDLVENGKHKYFGLGTPDARPAEVAQARAATGKSAVENAAAEAGLGLGAVSSHGQEAVASPEKIEHLQAYANEMGVDLGAPTNYYLKYLEKGDTFDLGNFNYDYDKLNAFLPQLGQDRDVVITASVTQPEQSALRNYLERTLNNSKPLNRHLAALVGSTFAGIVASGWEKRRQAARAYNRATTSTR